VAPERKKILLPPLRERPQDIPELTKYFFSQDKFRKKEILDDAMAVLTEYQWPGNVRELKRVCEQLILTAPLPVLRREDVLQVVRPAATGLGPANYDFNRGLAELVNEFEAQIIQKSPLHAERY